MLSGKQAFAVRSRVGDFTDVAGENRMATAEIAG